MISYDDFKAREGTIWAHEPNPELSGEQRLIWWLSEHLSAYAEMTTEAEIFAEADPAALYFLKLAEDYFLALRTPRPPALSWWLACVTQTEPRHI